MVIWRTLCLSIHNPVYSLYRQNPSFRFVFYTYPTNYGLKRILGPVGRNLPNPVDSAVFHWHIRIKAASHSACDELSPVAFQQLDLTLQFVDKPINLRSHLIQELNDLLLLCVRWQRDR